MNIFKSSSLRSSSTDPRRINTGNHDQNTPSIVSIEKKRSLHERLAPIRQVSIEKNISSHDHCDADLAPGGQNSPSSAYHDFSSAPDIEIPCKTKGGVKVPFPVKLFHLLEHIDLYEPEIAKIISWQPHGRCFMTHDIKRIKEQNILSRFSRQKNYSSFRRQLNLWGFKRIIKGPDQGAYYHELFLRGKPYLCRSIERLTHTRKPAESSFNPSEEEVEPPKFHTMPVLPPSFPTFVPATPVMNVERVILPPWAESSQNTEKQEHTMMNLESQYGHNHTAAHRDLTVYPIGNSPPATEQEMSDILNFLHKLDEFEK